MKGFARYEIPIDFPRPSTYWLGVDSNPSAPTSKHSQLVALRPIHFRISAPLKLLSQVHADMYLSHGFVIRAWWVFLRKIYSQATDIHSNGGIWIGVIRD